MSKRVEAKIQCPSCGLSKQMSLYRSLWVEDPANLALVMSDTLNLFECSQCGLREQLPFAVLCTNVKRSIAIWYEPEPDSAVDDDIRQYTAQFGPNHFFSRAERIADWEHFKRRLSELLNAGQHSVRNQPIAATRPSAAESAQRSTVAPRRSVLFRLTAFCCVVWISGVLLFAVLFDPYNLGDWSYADSDTYFHLFATALAPPAFVAAVVYGYQKFVRGQPQ